MPRKRKHCPFCAKVGLVKLSNHLSDIHGLSSEQSQSYLIRAETTDLETILVDLYKLIGTIKRNK